MYKLIAKKWGVSVYCNGTLTALIDNEFAISQGYTSAEEYCKKVFLEEK